MQLIVRDGTQFAASVPPKPGYRAQGLGKRIKGLGFRSFDVLKSGSFRFLASGFRSFWKFRALGSEDIGLGALDVYRIGFWYLRLRSSAWLRGFKGSEFFKLRQT